ncbi:MAG: hypothetical protein WAL32_05060, partial [Terriglobales bacterium]
MPTRSAGHSRNHSYAVFIAGFLLLAMIPANVHAADTAISSHSTTQWDLQPSLKFDVICALNMLSGDPYYLKYHQADYDRLVKQFRHEELAAFVNLKRRIKDENGGIISASLALYFSAVDAQSLDDLIRTVQDSSAMRRNLQATPYYSEEGWKLYQANRPDLETAFRALKRIHFDEDWEKNVKPKIEQARAAIAAKLPEYNVIPAVEAVLGKPRPTNKITVYLLYYSQPHGIKITGTRFLTYYLYPFRIVLRNAIHEMMHPPYDLAGDTELRAALESLKSDTFLMNKVEHHNKSFGYNTLAGLEEEDSVQALEQILAEKFGMGGDPQRYWKEQDDGIHVFAVALYSLMKQQKFDGSRESFPVFLKRQMKSGALSNGRIEKLNQEFF